jgi:membrane fusion protein (multidrug efflux system)
MTEQLKPVEAGHLLPLEVQDSAAVIEPEPAAAHRVARRGGLRRLLFASAAAALLAAAGWYGWDYWKVGRYLVSTDDAYVKADNTTVAPKVSGYIGEVLVGDNEPVGSGQVLARIDDRDFKVALEQARADVVAADAAVASKRAQFGVQQAVIAAAKATLDVDTAAQTFASQENKRYGDLAKTGYGSVQNAQAAQSRDAGALAAIERDTANLASARK